jgi:hypothetical protein
MPYKLIFTVARMNPPTPGHFELIKKMFEEAIHYGVKKIYIILSSKTDDFKNPLEPEEKKYLLETYGIPWIRRQLMGLTDGISVDIIMTHEHNYFQPNDIWGSIRFVLNKNENGKALFIAGEDSTIPFDKSVDIILLDRKKNPISGTLVRAIGYLSLPALESIYQPFGISQKEVYIIYSAIRRLDPPDDNILSMARTMLRERYCLRLRKN